MRSRRERQQHENVFYHLLHSRALLAAEVIILILVSIALSREVITRYTVQREIRELEKQYGELERQNVEIGSVISYLESDAFAEEEARTKLGLKKEGESVILLPRADQIVEQSSNPSSRDAAAQNTRSNTSRWWQYFFGTRI